MPHATNAPRTMILAACALAMLLPGCRLRPRAELPLLSEERTTPMSDEGLRSVFVSIQTGPLAKPSREPVTLSLRWRGQVIVTETIGRDQRWEAGSTRAVEFPLSPPIRMDAPGALVLEISKPSLEGREWHIQVEALGRLTDGGVLALLDRTPPLVLGASAPERSTWVLHSR